MFREDGMWLTPFEHLAFHEGHCLWLFKRVDGEAENGIQSGHEQASGPVAESEALPRGEAGA